MDGPKSGSSLEDVLEHFGVKGMKWGQRKAREDGPVSKDTQRAREHAKTIKKHGTAALSNKELQEYVTRMNLERQYNGFKAEPKAKKGQRYVKEVLAIGRTANEVYAFVNSPVGKEIKAALKR